jgi:polysaccharide pyruvyl transferase WcaK-like protein
MKTAIVHGCYNTTNFGDLLLLEIIAKYLKEKWAIESKTYKLPKGIELEYCSVSRSPFYWLRPDYAVFGGGGYLHDDNGEEKATKRLLRYSLPACMWKILKVPYAIIAPGGGPSAVGVGASRIKSLCKNASHISLRDDVTLNFVKELGIERTDIVRTADLALTLKLEDIPLKHRYDMSELRNGQAKNKKIIGIHLEIIYQDPVKFKEFCDLEFFKDDTFLKKFHLIFFYDYKSENIEEIKKVLNAIKDLSYSIVLRMNHWKTVDFLRQCDAILTTKLHVSIVSAAFGVPVFGFSFHEKTARFFKEIGRAEYQQMWSEGMLSINSWMQQLNNDNQQAWNLSQTHMDKIKDLANNNYSLLDEYVESRNR